MTADGTETDMLTATPPLYGAPPTGRDALLSPPQAADEIGRLGPYRVLKPLGSGGMATVYLAEDSVLKRRVALKVMKPDLDHDLDGWLRFEREAQLMAAVRHDHLVTVYQVGKAGDAIFLAMECLDGQTLDDWFVTACPVPPAEVLRIGKEVAAGLAALHAKGLIHRDVKPANLWREEPSGRVRILDFGLARLIDDDAKLTKTGLVVGTPAYMSPEQARGEPLDARTDLFSLGSVLYFLCTGAPPFAGSNTLAVLTALAVSAPKPVRELNPAVPKPLSDLIAALLSKDPEVRPSSTAVVVAEIERIEAGGRPRRAAAKRGRRWPWLVGVALVAAAGVWFAPKPPPPSPRPERGPGGRLGNFLSDMQAFRIREWNRKPPPDVTDGTTLRVGDRVLRHGLFMHPPMSADGGVSSITYHLAGRYQRFRTTAAFLDAAPGDGNPVVFTVLGDGEQLWESRPIRGANDFHECDVPVDRVRELTLQVHCRGRANGAFAVWVDPWVAAE